MDHRQLDIVELDEQLWQKWVGKGRLRDQARRRRWRIIGGIAGGGLLFVIGLLGWMGRT